eukprot:1965499-Pyramimonas_sp.AAC.1
MVAAKDSAGLDEQNQDMLYRLVCYLGCLSDMGQCWTFGGDWNMLSATFDGQAWLQQLRAMFLVPTQTTCFTTNASESSAYDYFVISDRLFTKVSPPE